MKRPTQQRRIGRSQVTETGSALLATLCFAAVLAISVASYLALCYRSLYLSTRDTNSARSVRIAEAGVEEALWSMTSGTWSNWTISGTTATKTLPDGTFSFEGGSQGRVVITIATTTGASFSVPLDSTQKYSITAVGTVTLPDGATLTRTLQSYAQGKQQLFTNAIGSTDPAGSISFLNGGVVDSYDSSAGNYSGANKTYSAIVTAPSVDIGSAQIAGYVGTFNLQNQSSGKIYGPSTPSGVNIDSSRVVSAVPQSTLDPATISGGSYLYDPNSGSSMLTNSVTLNTAGTYRLDYINLNNSAILTISAPVIIKVRYWVQTQGSAQIHITDTGSLQLQIDENNGFGLYLQGGGIVNDSMKPQNVSVLVGRTYTGASQSVINTTTPFYGTMYFPNDAVSVSNNFTLFGAMVGKSFSFGTTATPSIHFDTHLLNATIAGFDASYVFRVIQLTEI